MPATIHWEAKNERNKKKLYLLIYADNVLTWKN